VRFSGDSHRFSQKINKGPTRLGFWPTFCVEDTSRSASKDNKAASKISVGGERPGIGDIWTIREERDHFRKKLDRY